MSATDVVYVFAISEVLKASLIDGGDTLALQLRDTGGDEIAILASMNVAQALSASIQTTLGESTPYAKVRRVQRRYGSRRQHRCSVIGDAPVLSVSLVAKA